MVLERVHQNLELWTGTNKVAHNLIMPTLKDKEIKDLLKAIKAGEVTTEPHVGYQQVCDAVPLIKKACTVSDFGSLSHHLLFAHSHLSVSLPRALSTGTCSSLGGQSTERSRSLADSWSLWVRHLLLPIRIQRCPIGAKQSKQSLPLKQLKSHHSGRDQRSAFRTNQGLHQQPLLIRQSTNQSQGTLSRFLSPFGNKTHHLLPTLAFLRNVDHLLLPALRRRNQTPSPHQNPSPHQSSHHKTP